LYYSLAQAILRPISNLKPTDFKAEIEQNAGIILDVRTPNEVSTGQIENA
jgi:rhodanese-related sulfurtransferase